jgi:Leucine-rich repeat (LRR) protein
LGAEETGIYVARTHLHGLDVSLCCITTLRDVFIIEIFNEQRFLRSVNLSGNYISAIPPKLFSYLADLKRLDISSVQVSEGPKLELATILDSMDVSYKEFRSSGDVVATGAVVSFDKIEKWHEAYLFTCNSFRQYICFNSSEIPPDSSVVRNFVTKTVWVKYINLSNNSLTVVSTQMAASLNRLTLVDLGNNPFTCNNLTLIEF